MCSYTGYSDQTQKVVYQHDTLWSSTPAVLPAPELWYSFKAAIIRRLTSSCCYDRMLWEWILVPRKFGCLPSLKVTEILPILHDSEWGWTALAGWSLWIWKSLLFGLPSCPLLPQSNRSALLSRFFPQWETEERRQAAKCSLTKHMAKAPTVLMLIIDQVIKADEEILYFESESCDCASLTCLERAAKRSILSITPESSSVSHTE